MAIRETIPKRIIEELIVVPCNVGLIDHECDDSCHEKSVGNVVRYLAGRLVVGAATKHRVGAEFRPYSTGWTNCQGDVACVFWVKSGYHRRYLLLNMLAGDAALSYCDPVGMRIEELADRYENESCGRVIRAGSNLDGDDDWGVEECAKALELGFSVLSMNDKLFDWATDKLRSEGEVKWKEMKAAIAEFPLTVPYLG